MVTGLVVTMPWPQQRGSDRRAVEGAEKLVGGGWGSSCCWNLGLTERNNAPGMPGTPLRQLSLWGGRVWGGGRLKGTSKNGIVWVLLSPTQARQVT